MDRAQLGQKLIGLRKKHRVLGLSGPRDCVGQILFGLGKMAEREAGLARQIIAAGVRGLERDGGGRRLEGKFGLLDLKCAIGEADLEIWVARVAKDERHVGAEGFRCGAALQLAAREFETEPQIDRFETSPLRIAPLAISRSGSLMAGRRSATSVIGTALSMSVCIPIISEKGGFCKRLQAKGFRHVGYGLNMTASSTGGGFEVGLRAPVPRSSRN